MGCPETGYQMRAGNGESSISGNKVTKQTNLNQLKAGSSPQ